MQVALSFPRGDTALLQWSSNLLSFITPAPVSFGLVALDVTNYQTLHDAFSDAVTACDPAVRNKPAVITKNAARAALINGATLLANKIYATPTVTVAQKVEIGMPPRATPTRKPIPGSSPVVEIISVDNWTVRTRLRAATGSSRGKLPGTAGASVFSFVGPTPPSNIGDWKFEGNIGRVNKFDVVFDDTLAAGTKVWLTAFWFNGSKQSGPASDPISANLPGGGVSALAA